MNEAIRGIYRNGVIEPTGPLKAAEGAEVYVVVPRRYAREETLALYKKYDSVQLATAVAFQNVLRLLNGREIAFVGADKVLNDAGRKEGLTVINPNEQL